MGSQSFFQDNSTTWVEKVIMPSNHMIHRLYAKMQVVVIVTVNKHSSDKVQLYYLWESN